MKIRKSTVAAGAVAVLIGTTGPLALPALASSHNAETTLTFDIMQVNAITFTNTTASQTSAQQDTDVNDAGQTIGFNVLYTTVTKTTITVNASFSLSGGLLYATETSDNDGKTYKGEVTGGTGTFAGVTGTIESKTKDGKAAVKIVYK